MSYTHTITETVAPTAFQTPNVDFGDNLNQPFFGIEHKVAQLVEVVQKISELPEYPEKLLSNLKNWKKDTEGHFKFQTLKGNEEAQAVAAEYLVFLYSGTIKPILLSKATTLPVLKLQEELELVRKNLLVLLQTLLPREKEAEDFLREVLDANIQNASFLAEMEDVSLIYGSLSNQLAASLEKISLQGQKIHSEAKKDTSSHLTKWDAKFEQQGAKQLAGLAKIEMLEKNCDASTLAEEGAAREARRIRIEAKLQNLIEREILK